MDGPCRVPLINSWLCSRAARKYTNAVKRGDILAVKELLSLFTATDSPDLRAAVIDGLGSLVSREQEDLICREVLRNGIPELVNLVIVRGYTPHDPADQALFSFVTGQKERLSGTDTAAGCPLLAGGYARADPAARRNALRRARDSRTCNLLAAALVGDPVTRSAGGWSPVEWEVVVSGLIQDRRWADLWQLAPFAPPKLTITAIAAIKSSGWTPPGDAGNVFSDILAVLPSEWSYPVPAAGLLTRSIGRPASRVVRLAFSPDSTLLATGSCDGIISVWQISTARNRVTISTGTGSARFLAIPPDNTRIIFGSDDGALHCHELQAGRRTWSWPGNGSGEAGAAVLSGDGLTVITGDTRGIVNVLFVDGGKMAGTIPAHPSPIACLAFSPDGIRLAAGHTDGTVSLLDLPARTCLSVLNGAGDAVRSITFSDDSSRVLVLYDRAPPSLWDTVSGTKVRVFSGQCGSVVCSAVSPAGPWCAAGCSDHTLRCWNWSGKVPVATVPFYSRHITCCAPAPDGNLLATGYSSGTIRLYTMPASALMKEFKGHKKAVTCCTISPDGTSFATASWDGTVKVWHLPSGEIRRTLEHHAGDVVSLAASPDRPAVIAAMSDGFARVYPDGELNPARVVDMYTPGIRAVAVSPGGTHLACAGTDATLRIWDLDGGSLVAGADRLSTTLRCLSWMPDGSELISGGWDGKIRTWSVTDCRQVRTRRGHASIVTCMALSRDGRLFATGSNDTTVGLWRTNEQVPYAVVRDSRSEVSALAISPDRLSACCGWCRYGRPSLPATGWHS